MDTERPLTIIAGLGPGLGTALAKKFIAEGHDVVGLTRSPVEPMDHLYSIPTDVSDERQVKKAFQLIDDRYPCSPSVFIHNTAELIINPFLQTSPASFEKVWKSMVLSAAMTSAECLNRMLKQGDGTMIFSGATAGIKAAAHFSAFASAKFALRGLVQSMAREFQPKGIHVAHVIIDGIIWTPRSQERFSPMKETCLLPEDIAEAYWHLSQQSRSAWSQEIDLRPDIESF